MNMLRAKSFLSAGLMLLAVVGCSRNSESISESRYIEPERLYQRLAANIRANPDFEMIVDIDHSRLAAKAGSSMPPLMS
jgi:predicted component of type VI protein secretion system